MKRFIAVSTICISFLLAGAISLPAQDDHHDRKEDKKQEHEERKEEHKARQEDRHEAHAEAKHEKHAEHRRIKEEHWREHFGREHHFPVRHITVVSGQRRFVYGGYRFGFIQPWPRAWAYTDDCYIDLIDGEYYLFNIRHPGVRIVVNVLP